MANTKNLLLNSNPSLQAYLEFTQIATPSNPTSGFNRIYFKADGLPYMLNSSGVETAISGGGGGGANTALSNLASVAINTALLPGADNTIALGSASFRWSALNAARSLLSAGTNALPAYSFIGDPDSGFYSSGANQISVALGGVEQIRFFIDAFAGGALLIPSEVGGFLVGGNGTEPGVSGVTVSAASSAYGPNFAAIGAGGNTPGYWTKFSRGSLATPTAALSGDFIGYFRFTGWNGSAYLGGSGGVQLLASAAENWTTSAMGTNFFIDTVPVGGTTVVASVGVGSDGALVMRRGTGGDIYFANDGLGNLGRTSNRPLNLFLKSYMEVGEIATPSNPPANTHRLYFKSDSNLYMKNAAGTESQVNSSSPTQTTFTLADNQFSPATIESFAVASYTSLIVDYSVVRNGICENGTLYVITDGTNTNIAPLNGSTGSTGITFSGTVSGGNLLLQYTSTNIGFTGRMKYYVQKWLA